MIITTRHNNLSDNIENIKLLPFSKEEVNELGDKEYVLPFKLSKAATYLKENKLLKVNDYINSYVLKQFV
ncbi:NTPase [Candidatus Rickettsia kedanie]|uniref:Uncharacterized protein n=1 Tax=Candidatus Rickettsia kedanie TaxID=3115352 RepID=A0ABP9TRI1_9RICK